jgi:hypothetical protein
MGGAAVRALASHHCDRVRFLDLVSYQLRSLLILSSALRDFLRFSSLHKKKLASSVLRIFEHSKKCVWSKGKCPQAVSCK